MLRTVVIVYASTSGHTEYVADALITSLANEKGLRTVKQRAELTKPEDLTKGDVLVLASSTWNTGNVEGQLNPHMFDLLMNRAAMVDLAGTPCAAVGLGDQRYFYTARAAEKLTEYVTTHKGSVLVPALKVINEPFDQKEKIQSWATELVKAIDSLPTKVS